MNKESEWLQYQEQTKKSKKPLFYTLGTLALCGLIAAGVYFWMDKRNTDENNTAQQNDTAQQNEVSQNSANNTSGAETQTNQDTSSNLASTGEVYIRMNVEDRRFSIEGTVSEQQTREEIATTTRQVFGEATEIDIQVDPTAETLPWESKTPSVISGMMGVLDGELLIDESSVQLVGVAPDDGFFGHLQKMITQEGFPELKNEVRLTNKKPPTFIAKVDGDEVQLSGELETQDLKNAALKNFEQLYPNKNITETIVVDDGVFTRIGFNRIGTYIAVMQPFGNYEAGTRNNQLFATVPEGFKFESNSAVLTEEGQKLAEGIIFYISPPVRSTTIVGHTDSTGSSEDNLELSKQRAQALADFLIEEGNIPEELIIVEGKGETEPVATNDTEEGKAQNRRLEIRHNAFPEN